MRPVVLALTLVLTAPAFAAAQAREVVIGVSYPMSGPNAQAGVDNKPVLEIAEQRIAEDRAPRERSHRRALERRAGIAQIDEPFGLDHRQRTQQDLLKQREDCDIHSDA